MRNNDQIHSTSEFTQTYFIRGGPCRVDGQTAREHISIIPHSNKVIKTLKHALPVSAVSSETTDSTYTYIHTYVCRKRGSNCWNQRAITAPLSTGGILYFAQNVIRLYNLVAVVTARIKYSFYVGHTGLGMFALISEIDYGAFRRHVETPVPRTITNDSNGRATV